MRKRHIASAALVSLFGVGLFACGGVDIGAGQYDTFRIAADGEPSVSPSSCKSDDGNKTTFFTGATFVVYGVPGANADQLYLELPGRVLSGGQEDSGEYVFSGKQTQVQDMDPVTITSVDSLTVSFTVDGTSITGDVVETVTVKCSGTCGGFDDTSCKTTTSFQGVEVKSPDEPPQG